MALGLEWHYGDTLHVQGNGKSLFKVTPPTCLYCNDSFSEFRFRALDKVSHVHSIQKSQTHSHPPFQIKGYIFFCLWVCLCIGVLGMLLRVMLCWFNMVWNQCSPPQTDFYLVSNWQYFVMLGTYVQLKPVVLSGHIFFVRTTDTESNPQTLWYCMAR